MNKPKFKWLYCNCCEFRSEFAISWCWKYRTNLKLAPIGDYLRHEKCIEEFGEGDE